MTAPLRPQLIQSLLRLGLGALIIATPIVSRAEPATPPATPKETQAVETSRQAGEKAQTKATMAPFQVASIEGEAWAKAPEAAARKSLAPGDLLDDGTTVFTGPKSRLKLILPGDIALEVQPDSEFKLVRKTADSPDWGAHLRKGGILSVVRNPAKRPSHFYVRTRSAAMGVRGTMFYVRSHEKEYDFFCDCMGSVTLQRPGDAKPQILNSRHHDVPKVVMIENGLIQEAHTVGAPLDHTDEDLQALKTLLGPEPAKLDVQAPQPRSTGASKAH